MVAAVVKGHNQQGELTQGEAMSCGLAYWFGGMQNPGRSHYAQAGQTKFAARGTRHLARSDKADNTNLFAGLTTEVETAFGYEQPIKAKGSKKPTALARSDKAADTNLFADLTTKVETAFGYKQPIKAKGSKKPKALAFKKPKVLAFNAENFMVAAFSR